MLSPGVERALEVALEAHAGQVRKGGGVPYVVHPLHVALILARHGADDETLQAGVLHDVVEDCDEWDLIRIEGMFGARVAAIVADVTEDKALSWEERKRHGIEHVPRMRPEAVRVKAADKLHNLSSMVVALGEARDPDIFWGRFRGGRARTLEIATSLVRALSERIEPALAQELHAALRQLVSLDRRIRGA